MSLDVTTRRAVSREGGGGGRGPFRKQRKKLGLAVAPAGRGSGPRGCSASVTRSGTSGHRPHFRRALDDKAERRHSSSALLAGGRTRGIARGRGAALRAGATGPRPASPFRPQRGPLPPRPSAARVSGARTARSNTTLQGSRSARNSGNQRVNVGMYVPDV